MEPETDQEIDANYEESLEILKRNTDDLYSSTRKAYKSFQKVLEAYKEDIIPFHEVKCRTHGVFKAWCLGHGFESHISLQEFIRYVLEEYGKQHRLNLSERTITLDPSLAKGMGFSKEETIHLHAFLDRAYALLESKS